MLKLQKSSVKGMFNIVFSNFDKKTGKNIDMLAIENLGAADTIKYLVSQEVNEMDVMAGIEGLLRDKGATAYYSRDFVTKERRLIYIK